MMTPANEISPEYGFGWALDPERGIVFHAGSNPGFEGLVTMIPEEKRGAVVLSNGGSGFGFGEIAPLLNGVTARALGLPFDGDANAGLRKALFIGLAAVPVLFVASIARSWSRRDRLRTKRGIAAELDSWGWPVLAVGLAWALLVAIPGMHDVPFAALYLFRPDIALLLALAAATAVLSAFFRLGLAKTGRARRSTGARPRSDS